MTETLWSPTTRLGGLQASPAPPGPPYALWEKLPPCLLPFGLWKTCLHARCPLARTVLASPV